MKQRNFRAIILVWLVIWILLKTVLVSASNAEMLAVIGGTVIDGNGGKPLKNSIVLIENDKIIAVGERGKVDIPASAKRMLVKDKYIIPGLMETNVHLAGVYSVEGILRFEQRLPEVIEESAQIALKNGITTVFDSWGPLQPLKKVRDSIGDNKTIGSRIFVAGNIVGFSGIFGIDFNSDAQKVLSDQSLKRINDIWEQGVGRDLLYMTPEQVRNRIRTYLKKNIDFLKYAVNPHGGGTGNEAALIMFSPRIQEIIVEEAHRVGKTVQTHTLSVEGVHLAIEAGVDLMQHCNLTGPVPFPKETVRLMAKGGIACAAFAFTNKQLQAADGTEKLPLPPNYKVAEINLQNMIEAGVNLLVHTDAYIKERLNPDWESDLTKVESDGIDDQKWGLLGEATFLWLKAMEEKGLSPMKGLQGVTRNVAAAYGKLGELGTIETGKFADILILDADPLADADNYRKIHAVIKGGQEVNRQALPLKPVFTRARH